MTGHSCCPFEEDVLCLDDGELDFGRRALVEAHLAVCPSCAHLEDLLDRAGHAVRSETLAPVGGVENALASLERVRPAPRPIARPVLLSLAAALLLVTWFVWRGADRGTPPPSRSPALDDQPAPTHPEPPSLDLPTPVALVGPDLEELLGALDLASDTLDVEAIALAERVAQRGAVWTSALARALDPARPELALRALAVALRVDSPQLPRRIARLAADPELGPSVARARSAVSKDAPDGAQVASIRRLADLVRSSAPDDVEPLLVRLIDLHSRSGSRLVLDLAAQAETQRVAWQVLDARREALLPEIRRLATGPHGPVAAQASRALGHLRDEASLPVLMRLARRHGTAGPATWALLQIGSPVALEAAVEAATRGAAPATAARSFAGMSQAEPYLIARLESPSYQRRREALELLAVCGGEATCEALATVDVGPELRPQMIHALAEIGGDAAARTLAGLVDGPALRGRLVEALGRTASSEAVAPLGRLATDGMERQVVAALADFPAEEGVALLVDLLDSRARTEALEALLDLPARLAVPELLARFGDPRRARRVREALTAIAGEDLGPRREAWTDWWERRT